MRWRNARAITGRSGSLVARPRLTMARPRRAAASRPARTRATAASGASSRTVRKARKAAASVAPAGGSRGRPVRGAPRLSSRRIAASRASYPCTTTRRRGVWSHSAATPAMPSRPRATRKSPGRRPGQWPVAMPSPPSRRGANWRGRFSLSRKSAISAISSASARRTPWARPRRAAMIRVFRPKRRAALGKPRIRASRRRRAGVLSAMTAAR